MRLGLRGTLAVDHLDDGMVDGHRLAPAFVQSDEGVLGDLLGPAAVVEDEVRRPQHRPLGRAEDPLELVPVSLSHATPPFVVDPPAGVVPRP